MEVVEVSDAVVRYAYVAKGEGAKILSCRSKMSLIENYTKKERRVVHHTYLFGINSIYLYRGIEIEYRNRIHVTYESIVVGDYTAGVPWLIYHLTAIYFQR